MSFLPGLDALVNELRSIADEQAAAKPPEISRAPEPPSQAETPAEVETVPIVADAFTPPPPPIERAPAEALPSEPEALEEAEARHEATRIARLESGGSGRSLPPGVTPTITIQIPAPMDHQAQVLDHPARFKAIRAGRRLGKTRLEFIGAVRGHGKKINVEKDPAKPPKLQRQWKGMAQGGDIVWIAPDYGQADAIWEEEILPRFEGRAGVTISEKHRLVGFGRELGRDRKGEPIYQGSLRLRSAENINSVRGKRFDGAIIDEAAFLKFFLAWRRVIRPTLIDRKGWAIIASTTDIGSDFNQLMAEVEAEKRGPSWHGWHFRTRDNPRIDAEELAELAQEYAPGSAEEQQELDAELLETLGTLFRAEFFHSYDHATKQAVWIGGLRYAFQYLVMTVDLASSLKQTADYTVVTIAGVCAPLFEGDIQRVAILHVEYHRIEGPEQLDAMEELAKTWRPTYVDIEKVQYQATAVQHMERRLKGLGLIVTGVPVDKDKRTRAVPAAAAMARGEWYWPPSIRNGVATPEAVWVADSKAQLLKFPNGKDSSKLLADHDDIVDTLSLLAKRIGGRANTTWKVRKIRGK